MRFAPSIRIRRVSRYVEGCSMRTKFAVIVAGFALSWVCGRSSRITRLLPSSMPQAVQEDGQVTKVEWMNPHTFFYIDVKDEKTGKVTNWAMEMGSPNGLMRAGWNRNTMKIGDKVTVEGSLAKDGSPTGNARAVVLTDTGQRLFAASSQGTTP